MSMTATLQLRRALVVSGRVRSFATKHQSERIEVAAGVSLHALVPTANETRPPVLCLPSAFGSVATDFLPQFDALSDKYTFIGIDPRGYGASRPPTRDFPDNYFERDADDILRIMDTLKYDKFSILGWSAGANVGAVFAAKYPDRVDRLVLVNGNAFVSDDDLDAFQQFQDVSTWHPAAQADGDAVYGRDALQHGWSSMLTKLQQIYERDSGDLYCASLPFIQCKTLVVAGGNDKLVDSVHSEYLSERIMHSRLHVFPDGRHDVHKQHAATFNDVLHTFLQEPDDKLTQSREFVARPATSASA